MSDQTTNDLKKRIDMLALTLSLKNNDQSFGSNGDYTLLFSTYIQMLKHDQDDFFLEIENRKKVIQSLERTKSFYQFEKKEQLQELFEKMGNNDSTDFMIFPSKCYMDGGREAHTIGLTVYKKNDEFIVVGTDKVKFFHEENVFYYKVPKTKIDQLSKLFFIERSQEYRKAASVLEDLETLSTKGVKKISSMSFKDQTVANCTVTEIEATLRTTLFNCRTDIFSLDDTQIVTPKWHPRRPDSTLEMRRRFATALKGPNPEWNQQVDHIFDYYLCRKTLFGKYPLPGIDRKATWWYQRIKFLFKYDPYIVEIRKGSSQLPHVEEEEVQKTLNKKIEPLGILHGHKLTELEFSLLRETHLSNKRTIDIINARLPFIQIPTAKEIAQRTIVAWETKNLEIEAEIKRRKEIGKETPESVVSTRDLMLLDQLPPIHPEDFELKKVVIFGEDQEKAQLVGNLDNLIERKQLFPYDPKYYTEEMYKMLTASMFKESDVKTPAFHKIINNATQEYSFWKEISQVVTSESGLRLIDLYPPQMRGIWRQYEQIKRFANQPVIEYMEDRGKVPLMNRAESIFIAVSKIYEDFEIWVPLDSRIKQIDQTINGERNDVFDISLRELYHQRNRIKAEVVFFENGQRVAPPWELKPERWKSCQKDHIDRLNEISHIEKTVLVYGTPEAREMLSNNHFLIKNIQGRSIVEMDVDRYSKLVVDTFFERAKEQRDKGEFKNFLENWHRLVANENDFPLLGKYYHISQAHEKLQLKTIFDPNNFEEYQKYTKAEIQEKFANKGRKIGLEMVAATSDMLIYFPLDSVNMFDVVHKKENSTGSDLRYLYRNWDRFKEKVVFIKEEKLVKAPWEEKHEIWKNYVPKSINKNTPSYVESSDTVAPQKATLEVLQPLSEESKKYDGTFTTIDKIKLQKANVLLNDSLEDFNRAVTQSTTVVKEDQVVVTSMNSIEKTSKIDSPKSHLTEEGIIQNKKEHVHQTMTEIKTFENISTTIETITPKATPELNRSQPKKTIEVLMAHATNQSTERSQVHQLRMTEPTDHRTKMSNHANKKTNYFSEIASLINRPVKKRANMPTKNVANEKKDKGKFRMDTLLTCFQPTKYKKKHATQQATKYPHKTMAER
ncbi:hypothetical protein [Candidatus Enterococcus mangumiae]|uniref:Uncharacterized protein n=1 Tax=Candidatus Enterococcus mangumiae TaxID=2230878 RepID=A0ABZ2SXF7_9ENTE|nr:hypothetical protein [Enterococcus sp. DIV1094]MBO0489160.1 hypothetical protein [Enterococcus sp. DIV1094]